MPKSQILKKIFMPKGCNKDKRKKSYLMVGLIIKKC